MSCVMVSTICHSCQKVFPEYWIDKDHKGEPVYEGLVCGNCGKRNTVHRYWSDTHISTPLSEDGELKRFEYSYTNKDGKKIEKSIPSHHITDYLNKKGKKV